MSVNKNNNKKKVIIKDNIDIVIIKNGWLQTNNETERSWTTTSNKRKALTKEISKINKKTKKVNSDLLQIESI